MTLLFSDPLPSLPPLKTSYWMPTQLEAFWESYRTPTEEPFVYDFYLWQEAWASLQPYTAPERLKALEELLGRHFEQLPHENLETQVRLLQTTQAVLTDIVNSFVGRHHGKNLPKALYPPVDDPRYAQYYIPPRPSSDPQKRSYSAGEALVEHTYLEYRHWSELFSNTYDVIFDAHPSFQALNRFEEKWGRASLKATTRTAQGKVWATHWFGEHPAPLDTVFSELSKNPAGSTASSSMGPRAQTPANPSSFINPMGSTVGTSPGRPISCFHVWLAPRARMVPK